MCKTKWFEKQLIIANEGHITITGISSFPVLQKFPLVYFRNNARLIDLYKNKIFKFRAIYTKQQPLLALCLIVMKMWSAMYLVTDYFQPAYNIGFFLEAPNNVKTIFKMINNSDIISFL